MSIFTSKLFFAGKFECKLCICAQSITRASWWKVCNWQTKWRGGLIRQPGHQTQSWTQIRQRGQSFKNRTELKSNPTLHVGNHIMRCQSKLDTKFDNHQNPSHQRYTLEKGNEGRVWSILRWRSLTNQKKIVYALPTQSPSSPTSLFSSNLVFGVVVEADGDIIMKTY